MNDDGMLKNEQNNG